MEEDQRIARERMEEAKIENERRQQQMEAQEQARVSVSARVE